MEVPSHTVAINQYERLVQEKLWQYGYRVRKERQFFGTPRYPYDLVIDDTTSLEVKAGKYKGTGFKFSFNGNRAHIYAFVFVYDDGTTRIRYAEHKEVSKRKKSKGAFLSSSWVLNIASPDEDWLYKSPYEVFGKPAKSVDKSA